jgi:hypothetical protein
VRRLPFVKGAVPANDVGDGSAALTQPRRSPRSAVYVCIGPRERACEVREKLAGILVTLFRESLGAPANNNGSPRRRNDRRERVRRSS